MRNKTVTQAVTTNSGIPLASSAGNAQTEDELIVEIIKQNHSKKSSEQQLAELLTRSKEQLASGFIIEKNAKNKAYYFILEKGHYNAFSEYCRSGREEGLSS